MTFWARIRTFVTGGRGRRLAELAEEVAGHWPHLPVLETQIREAVQQVETSVTAVCGAFEGMARRARESVAGALRLLGTDKNSGIEMLLTASRQTLARLQQQIEGGQQISAQALAHMQVMEGSGGEIVKALAEIDRIALGNKLVALNAKVEAAHFGDQGAAFGVVAESIAAQARRSEEITARVATEMVQLRNKVAAASASLKEIGRMSVDTLQASRADLEAALGELTKTHGQLEGALGTAVTNSRELADEIARSVVALQLQDSVSQRLSHVADELAEMRKNVHVPLEYLAQETPVLGQARRKEVGARLEARYTMAAEREAGREDEGPRQTICNTAFSSGTPEKRACGSGSPRPPGSAPQDELDGVELF
ncbi:MAG TPA: methyl-accepting chemotaxis protein [Bryobacteraceae bacterium]|nr:methyl-accepting chemotaxis protein [Bryobacteraceae bacterium]